MGSPKLLESLLAVLRHVIKSEEFVRKQTEKENKEDEDEQSKRGAESHDRASKRFRSGRENLRHLRNEIRNSTMSPAEHLQSIISEFSQNIEAAGAASSSVGDLVRASLQSVSNQTAQATPVGVGDEALAEAQAGPPTTAATTTEATTPTETT